MGICVGLQALFEGSAENPSVPGLALLKQRLTKFDNADKSVPHIGWNSASIVEVPSNASIYGLRSSSKYYYVHSYAVPYEKGLLEAQGWAVATAKYGNETFIGAVAKQNILATQFHPEKSGVAGLRVLKAFLGGSLTDKLSQYKLPTIVPDLGLTRRVIACLDVRTNDQGDLVVTKGDQYDVREKGDVSAGQVRNLGKPVDMARRYYEQGADEITFLNVSTLLMHLLQIPYPAR